MLMEYPTDVEPYVLYDAALRPAPRTVAEYLAMPDGPPYYQFIHGIAKKMASPTRKHQETLAEIFSLMRLFVKHHRLGKVLIAPLDVYFNEKNYVQPDVMFVSNERAHILQTRIQGAPDLIVEILSPSNIADDVVDKKALYESFGVHEYWIVNPMTESIEVWVNGENGFVCVSRAENGTGNVESRLLQGFSVDVVSIFTA
jgi:Uma2 family endonuclease